jgi:hypothetical protein
VRQYLNQFVLSERLSIAQRLFGAWEGLRFGWVLVAAAIFGSWKVYSRAMRLEPHFLMIGLGITVLVGLFTAQDLSRSLVIIIPVVPLGWIFASRTVWWNKFYAAPIFAVAALLLPARYVVGKLSGPVDNLWSPPRQLMSAESNLGVLYFTGDGVTKDSLEAVRWFRKAAEEGHDVAQLNLGAMYVNGEGVPQDSTEGARWYRRAAEQGNAQAQNHLGTMYVNGNGATRDNVEAVRWFRKAAAQGLPDAQKNLGVMYINGEGVAKDLVQAYFWLSVAGSNGEETARRYLAIIEKGMTAEQIFDARMLVSEKL